MKIDFGADTLGDDAPASGARRTIQIVSMPGQCEIQVEPLAGGPNPFAKAQGNVQGSLVFRVTNTFTTIDLANQFIIAEYARIGVTADLIWSRATTLFTFASAILRSTQPVWGPQDSGGVKVVQEYNFFIRTVSLTA